MPKEVSQAAPTGQVLDKRVISQQPGSHEDEKSELMLMKRMAAPSGSKGRSVYQETTTESTLPDVSFLRRASSRLKFRSPKEDCAPEDCCCCLYFIYLLFNQEIKPPAYEGNAAMNMMKVPMKLAKGGAGKLVGKKIIGHDLVEDVSKSVKTPGYSYFKDSTSNSVTDAETVSSVDDGASTKSTSCWFANNEQQRNCSAVNPASQLVPDDADDDVTGDASDGWMVQPKRQSVSPSGHPMTESVPENSSPPASSDDQNENQVEELPINLLNFDDNLSPYD